MNIKKLKAIIDRTASNERVEQYHNSANSEMLYNNDEQNKLRRIAKQDDLIISLDNSGSFSTTHAIISELSKFTDWTSEQVEKLQSIAEENSQVRLILSDEDVHNFYRTIEKYKWALEFYDKYAVCVNSNSKKYHKYGCDDFDESYFWIYNIEAAEQEGYYPCPKCH